MKYLLSVFVAFILPSIAFADVIEPCILGSGGSTFGRLGDTSIGINRGTYNAGDSIIATFYSPACSPCGRGSAAGQAVDVYARIDGWDRLLRGQYVGSGGIGSRTAWSVSTQLIAPSTLGSHDVTLLFPSGHASGRTCRMFFTITAPTPTVTASLTSAPPVSGSWVAAPGGFSSLSYSSTNAMYCRYWADGVPVLYAGPSNYNWPTSFSWPASGSVYTATTVRTFTCYNSSGTASAPSTVTLSVDNRPTPPTISGPTSRTTGNAGTYTVSATDSDNNQIRYGIDWDMDSNAEEWLPSGVAYVNSGTTQSTTHSWATAGTKTFQVVAQDTIGFNSAWTAYTVTVYPACTPANTTWTSACQPAVVCGALNAGQTFVTGLRTGTCPDGTPTTGSCTLSPALTCPLNGACGAAAAPQSNKPTGPSLCAAGSSSAVSPASGDGPWTWTCVGTGGGSTASCLAPYTNASGATCPNTVCEGNSGETPITCPTDCKVKFRQF